jgi:hypothetical protein
MASIASESLIMIGSATFTRSNNFLRRAGLSRLSRGVLQRAPLGKLGGSCHERFELPRELSAFCALGVGAACNAAGRSCSGVSWKRSIAECRHWLAEIRPQLLPPCFPELRRRGGEAKTTPKDSS